MICTSDDVEHPYQYMLVKFNLYGTCSWKVKVFIDFCLYYNNFLKMQEQNKDLKSTSQFLPLDQLVGRLMKLLL